MGEASQGGQCGPPAAAVTLVGRSWSRRSPIRRSALYALYEWKPRWQLQVLPADQGCLSICWHQSILLNCLPGRLYNAILLYAARAAAQRIMRGLIWAHPWALLGRGQTAFGPEEMALAMTLHSPVSPDV